MSIVVITATCPEDVRWFNQYLDEVDRLGLKFIIHFDQFRYEDRWLTEIFLNNQNCVGSTSRPPGREFEEWDKQGVISLAKARGYDWALAVDIDETFEESASEKLEDLVRMKTGVIKAKYVHLWDDPQHMRIDGPFMSPVRDKLYDLKNHDWRYTSKITNGPYGTPTPEVHESNLVCLHHGFMTKLLRIEHKERWDRIYGAAVGKNPYGLWAYAVDEETYPATIVEHPYGRTK